MFFKTRINQLSNLACRNNTHLNVYKKSFQENLFRNHLLVLNILMTHMDDEILDKNPN